MYTVVGHCDCFKNPLVLSLVLWAFVDEDSCSIIIFLTTSLRLMLGFMGVTAFLSMWISNTATTAMMVPIVQAILDQLNCNVDAEPSSKSQRKSVVLHMEHEEKTGSVPQTATPNILENGKLEQLGLVSKRL